MVGTGVGNEVFDGASVGIPEGTEEIVGVDEGPGKGIEDGADDGSIHVHV